MSNRPKFNPGDRVFFRSGPYFHSSIVIGTVVEDGPKGCVVSVDRGEWRSGIWRPEIRTFRRRDSLELEGAFYICRLQKGNRTHYLDCEDESGPLARSPKLRWGLTSDITAAERFPTESAARRSAPRTKVCKEMVQGGWTLEILPARTKRHPDEKYVEVVILNVLERMAEV